MLRTAGRIIPLSPLALYFILSECNSLQKSRNFYRLTSLSVIDNLTRNLTRKKIKNKNEKWRKIAETGKEKIPHRHVKRKHFRYNVLISSGGSWQGSRFSIRNGWLKLRLFVVGVEFRNSRNVRRNWRNLSEKFDQFSSNLQLWGRFDVLTSKWHRAFKLSLYYLKKNRFFCVHSILRSFKHVKLVNIARK